MRLSFPLSQSVSEIEDSSFLLGRFSLATERRARDTYVHSKQVSTNPATDRERHRQNDHETIPSFIFYYQQSSALLLLPSRNSYVQYLTTNKKKIITLLANPLARPTEKYIPPCAVKRALWISCSRLAFFARARVLRSPMKHQQNCGQSLRKNLHQGKNIKKAPRLVKRPRTKGPLATSPVSATSF